MKLVNNGIRVRLYPDDDMKVKIHQNIGNARFIWNHLLVEYLMIYQLFQQNGYDKLLCNWNTFNTLLNMLMVEYPFLKKSESSSRQQVYIDLIRAFNNYFNGKAGKPRFKSKKHSKKSFRIQMNSGNIKIKNNTIILPKLGEVYFRTSPEYKNILKNDKINNVTIKIENGKYYAAFNVESPQKFEGVSFGEVGIDLGMKTLATLSNGLKIANLDVSKEDEMIKKYQKIMSRRQPNSNRYKKTQKTYWKWIDKKKNKINDHYHKLSHFIVKTNDLICMENLNIKGMFKNPKQSPKLQKIGLYKLMDMIKKKAEKYDKDFIQVGRFYPSSKTCNNCGYYYKDLNWNETKWTCPDCGETHDRDINAAKNILNEGQKILRRQMMNLWCRGDSTVILLSWESTSP